MLPFRTRQNYRYGLSFIWSKKRQMQPKLTLDPCAAPRPSPPVSSFDLPEICNAMRNCSGAFHCRNRRVRLCEREKGREREISERFCLMNDSHRERF